YALHTHEWLVFRLSPSRYRAFLLRLFQDRGKSPSKIKKKEKKSPKSDGQDPKFSPGPESRKKDKPLADSPANDLKKFIKRSTGKAQPSAFESPLPKELKSAPFYQKGIAALVAKVRGRKKSKSESRSLSMDEITYPSTERKVRGRKVVQSDESAEGESTLLMYDTCAEISTIQDVKQARLAYSGMPIVTGNNCNGNKLFVDDMPFWWSDEVSDITDSELVMNASVLIEALEGRLKLVPMPDVEIVLDPIEDVTILRTRDKLCFRREHIFGNTVRSMVNLNELSIRSLRTSSRKSQRKKQRRSGSDHMQPLDMEEPSSRMMYARNNFKEVYSEEYTPSKTIRYSIDPPVMELEQ
ncbi:hypothetical protein V3C99_004772, partial [Haemonchus contortus]